MKENFSEKEELSDTEKALLDEILKDDSDEEIVNCDEKIISQILQSDDDASPSYMDHLAFVNQYETVTKFKDIPKLIQHLEGNRKEATSNIARIKYNNHTKASTQKEDSAEQPTCISVY